MPDPDPAAPGAASISTSIPPSAIEAVLRLAARALMPRLGYHPFLTLAGVAERVRAYRAAWEFDVETSREIDGWLAVYEGREAGR